MRRPTKSIYQFIVVVSFSYACVCYSTSAIAMDVDDATVIRKMIEEELVPRVASSRVIAAIKEQNQLNQDLTRADIKRLDLQWREEIDEALKPLINSVLTRPLSLALHDIIERNKGRYTEIIVIDRLGLNVAQSSITSDYWQGDEAKWQKTFLEGPNAIFIDLVDLDESTQVFQSQVSFSITDPESNEVIGVVTVGINVGEVL